MKEAIVVYSLIIKNEVKVLGYLPPPGRPGKNRDIFYRVFSEKTGDWLATVKNEEMLNRLLESFKK